MGQQANQAVSSTLTNGALTTSQAEYQPIASPGVNDFDDGAPIVSGGSGDFDDMAIIAADDAPGSYDAGTV